MNIGNKMAAPARTMLFKANCTNTPLSPFFFQKEPLVICLLEDTLNGDMDPMLEIVNYHREQKEIFIVIGMRSWDPLLQNCMRDNKWDKSGLCLERRKGVKQTIIRTILFVLQMREQQPREDFRYVHFHTQSQLGQHYFLYYMFSIHFLIILFTFELAEGEQF